MIDWKLCKVDFLKGSKQLSLHIQEYIYKGFLLLAKMNEQEPDFLSHLNNYKLWIKSVKSSFWDIEQQAAWESDHLEKETNYVNDCPVYFLGKVLGHRTGWGNPAGPGNLAKWRSSEFEEVTVAQVHWKVQQREKRAQKITELSRVYPVSHQVNTDWHTVWENDLTLWQEPSRAEVTICGEHTEQGSVCVFYRKRGETL